MGYKPANNRRKERPLIVEFTHILRYFFIFTALSMYFHIII